MPRHGHRNLKRRQALVDQGKGHGAGRDDVRHYVAYLAARFIAEEGAPNYAAAKQKAARQAGLTDAHALPDNHEIDVALREYQELYHGKQHPLQLRWLREVAVEVMRLLSPFNPHLTGPVLSGVATEFSDINLQVFADDCKLVELFLINQRIPYRTELFRIKAGDKMVGVPILNIVFDDAPVSIAVYATNDIRIARRSAGHPPGRAKIDEVEALLNRENADVARDEFSDPP